MVDLSDLTHTNLHNNLARHSSELADFTMKLVQDGKPSSGELQQEANSLLLLLTFERDYGYGHHLLFMPLMGFDCCQWIFFLLSSRLLPLCGDVRVQQRIYAGLGSPGSISKVFINPRVCTHVRNEKASCQTGRSMCSDGIEGIKG